MPTAPPIRKIATCCYCGARTVLTLGGVARHELACGRCGAPISTMKPLKAEIAAPPAPAPKPRPAAPPPDRRQTKAPSHGRDDADRSRRDAKPKRGPKFKPGSKPKRKRAPEARRPKRRDAWVDRLRRRLGRSFEDVFDDLIDVVEDVFD